MPTTAHRQWRDGAMPMWEAEEVKQDIHILVPNHSKRAPFADQTVCGIDISEYENIPAVWPDEVDDPKHLDPDWDAKDGYCWCLRCKKK